MKEIKLNITKPHSVVITSTASKLNFWLEQKKLNRLFIITDENVDSIYKDYFNLVQHKVIGKYVIKSGEESKNIDTIMDIYQHILKLNIDRKSTIVSFGGGVVGDIAGFIASTFKRGTNLLHVPTTVVAQTDSSIGGKNGFNFGGVKNIIGTFYQPDLVYIDINILKTLDYKYFKEGIAEVIKYGFSMDKNLFEFIENNKRSIKEREIDKLLHIITECVKLKASIVEEDELDLGKRHILNFGHTIGHAIESISDFRVRHGEAVAIGMVYESYIALKNKYIMQQELERLIKILRYFELPIDFEIDNYTTFKENIVKDKKNVDNCIKIVLPQSIGHAIITSDIKLETIIQYIQEFNRRVL